MPELLAPARDREAFLAAVAAGADAVYVGVAGGLNARRRAAGLAEDELPALCALAHAHGTRVYVAANVVVKQGELAAAVEAARRAAVAGADALIVQDWGFFAELRRVLPELELHVSTQANVHDARGVAWAAGHGASRVTLSRELSLTEIAAIAEAERVRAAADERPCELEVFAHGAICPSYSGLCMLSSYLREGRSPNRGLCAQPCRLPFDLVAADACEGAASANVTGGAASPRLGDGAVIAAANGADRHLCPGEQGIRLQPRERERALCTHDNCAIDDIPALAAVGVASLKIEGRMKPVAYVHAVTAAWRAELGALATGECEGDANGDGHLALGVGEADVSACSAGERAFPSADGLNRGALLRRRALKRSFNRGFTDAYLHDTSGNELMSYERSGNRGELVGEIVGFEPEPGFVPRDGQQLRGEAIVCLVAPVDEGDSLELRPLDDPERFLVAKVSRDAATGELLRVHVPRPMPAGCEARVTKSVALECAAAEAVAAMEAELRLSLRHSERSAEGAESKNLVAACSSGTSCCGREGLEACAPVGCAKDAEVCVLVERPEDALALCRAGATSVYLDVIDIAPTPEALAAARAVGCIPVLDELCREPDHARIDPWVVPGQPVAVGNVSELALAAERGAAAEVRSCIPVHNAGTAHVLARSGTHAIWLSPELSLAEAGELASAIRQDPECVHLALGMLVSGRPRLMTCEHCALQVAYDCDRNHTACPHRQRSHALVNIDGRHLPVRADARGRSRIYLDEPVDLVPHAQELVAAGISRLLIDVRGLDATATEAAITRLREALDGGSVSLAGGPGLLHGGVA